MRASGGSCARRSKGQDRLGSNPSGGGRHFRLGRNHRGRGRWLTPGLIDCQTHLVYGGNRAHEWESRFCRRDLCRYRSGWRWDPFFGPSNATRERKSLLKTRPRGGFTTSCETASRRSRSKSGYGLNLDTEQKMLRVAKRLDRQSRSLSNQRCCGARDPRRVSRPKRCVCRLDLVAR